MPNDTVYTELAKLRDRVAELEYEKAQAAETRASEVAEVMRATGFTIGQSQLIIALCSGRPLSRETLADKCEHREASDIRLVDCHIKKMRQKLLRKSIKITTYYGFGYGLDDEHLTRARAFIKGELQ